MVVWTVQVRVDRRRRTSGRISNRRVRDVSTVLIFELPVHGESDSVSIGCVRICRTFSRTKYRESAQAGVNDLRGESLVVWIAIDQARKIASSRQAVESSWSAYLVSVARDWRRSPPARCGLECVDSVSTLLETCCRPDGYGGSVSPISAIDSEYWLPEDDRAVPVLSASLLAVVSYIH